MERMKRRGRRGMWCGRSWSTSTAAATDCGSDARRRVPGVPPPLPAPTSHHRPSNPHRPFHSRYGGTVLPPHLPIPIRLLRRQHLPREAVVTAESAWGRLTERPAASSWGLTISSPSMLRAAHRPHRRACTPRLGVVEGVRPAGRPHLHVGDDSAGGRWCLRWSSVKVFPNGESFHQLQVFQWLMLLHLPFLADRVRLKVISVPPTPSLLCRYLHPIPLPFSSAQVKMVKLLGDQTSRRP
ncbi:unnamed protein product [Urochloa humidicola]